MKTALLAALGCGLALSLAACGEKDCTAETLQQKHRDLQDAMTSALAKDPAKAMSNQQTWAKALDLMARTQSAGASPAQALCKDYDEQIEAVRKQSS